jgi:hypothetical protein
MLDKDQNQSVGQGGVAIQATGNVTVGLSYSDAKSIALDVFNANFYKLSAEAMKVAEARAIEITDIFLEKLQAENPSGFEKGQDPDFQHALFTTQKEYARSGDKELGDLLVDLLVDRSKQEERGILQIVLNESLLTAPKLTSSQLAALAVVFACRYTQNPTLGEHIGLGNYFDLHMRPFYNKLESKESCYQHLEFTGCGSVQMGEVQLETAFSQHYQGLFLKGFDRKEIERQSISLPSDHHLFVQCLNDPQKIQVKALSLAALEAKLIKFNIDPDNAEKMKNLFNFNLMTPEEIRSKCIEIRPYMEHLFDVWSNSSLKNFNLTSVGMAIGHANIKKISGEFASLSIWIN